MKGQNDRGNESESRAGEQRETGKETDEEEAAAWISRVDDGCISARTRVKVCVCVCVSVCSTGYVKPD